VEIRLADEDGGIPRWLKIVGAVVTPLGIIFGVLTAAHIGPFDGGAATPSPTASASKVIWGEAKIEPNTSLKDFLEEVGKKSKESDYTAGQLALDGYGLTVSVEVIGHANETLPLSAQVIDATTQKPVPGLVVGIPMAVSGNDDNFDSRVWVQAHPDVESFEIRVMAFLPGKTEPQWHCDTKPYPPFGDNQCT
jgi:hypothetical protein